jgi:GT2 family glycosyltransferase
VLTDDDLAATGLAVERLRPGRNVGFAGGVNAGLDHLGAGRQGGPEFVALVNNDAFVAPGWLTPLVEAMTRDPKVGAAQGKLVFEPTFAPLVVSAPLRTSERGPALGVRVEGPEGTVPSSGFVAVCPGEWWTTETDAVLCVPAPRNTGTTELTFTAPGGTTVHVEGLPIDIGDGPTTTTIVLPGHRVDVIQNAGNELTDDLWVRDRGAREIDGGQYDEPADVWGWCGGLVLLRAAYLADVGRLDDRFFLYWEDVDLSWRGARRGWRYRYEPASTARHVHGASMGDRSPTFDRLNQRNRLVVLARYAGRRPAVRAWARTLAEAGWFLWRDVGRAVIHRERPSLRRVTVRLRAVGGALALLVRGRHR